ncbi:MAG TPA: hypothetical protein VJU16_04825 [Planctomycetota bacterium]|nr:hypothetical protein [Planctomycetota bacterium]
MIHETPRPARRGTVLPILAGVTVFVLAVAAYFEFISPSKVETRRETFGYFGDLQVNFVTTTSPLLKRVVRRELKLSGRNGTRMESPSVAGELWERRDELKKWSQVCWAEGKSESNVLWSMLSLMAAKNGDEKLTRFLSVNQPS